MSKKRDNPSWERAGFADVFHSPAGIRKFKDCLKDGLTRKIVGMAESMWAYKLEDEAFQDFCLMSLDCEPEKTLMKTSGCWFEIPGTGQLHFLPAVLEGGINIYGNFAGWHPMPIGYVDGIDSGKDAVRDSIRNLHLDATNSVLMRDNLFGKSDYEFIVESVNALVDTCMTISQLTFLMKAPFIIRVPQSRINDAKQFMLAIASDALYILQYADTEEMQTAVEQTGVTFDPGLFDIYRHWENQLLAQLGIPGAQVTQKRTVQTEDEIHLGDDMITLRRQEKFRMRKLAIDRVNRMFGTHAEVISVIDSMQDNKERENEEENEEKQESQEESE
jgi:hypothetical protein